MVQANVFIHGEYRRGACEPIVAVRSAKDFSVAERTPTFRKQIFPGKPLTLPEHHPMVEEGKPAPDFTLADQQGKKVTLSKLKGSPVVLYFYPKDDTPGCTKEACAFRDAFADYKKAGAVILGISPDDSKSHAKFVEKFDLPFPLLADHEKQVCEAYGVWKEKSMYGKKYMGVERTTFVIDKKGIVGKVFPKVRVDGHSDEVLDAVKASK
jgi:thioredoxin-dependent peroxiredoxin